MAETHKIMGGKVNLYRRENSRHWQCSSFLGGRNHRVSTKEDSLSRAKDFAEDWYLGLRQKNRDGTLRHEKTFAQAAEQYLLEYEVITGGTRNAIYVEGNRRRLRKYLIPFFGELGLSEVTAGKLQEYRIMRQTNTPTGKPPAKNTIHQEVVVLRQVLKTAIRHNWLSHLPDFSTPYRTAEKVSHRAWFSADEYRKLYTATRKHAEECKGKRWEHEAAQTHDFVLFMANTGLRPDEANRLEYRDVEIAEDDGMDETILVIEVRGKRGVGYCKSTPGAVVPFQRLVERNKPQPTDLIFPNRSRAIFTNILDQEGLRFDREGTRRTAYSLRHTYISLRLMEGADIYQIAKNCRTSVEMIEKYYAAHIRTSISAAAVNVKRQKKTPGQLKKHAARNAHRG